MFRSLTLILAVTTLCHFDACRQCAAQQFGFELSGVHEPVNVRAETSELTAVCFLGTECPMARAYASRLNELSSTFAERGLRIVGVFSNSQDSLAEVQAFAAELNVKFDAAHDKGNFIADLYGATRTPEVYLLDRQLILRYHGRIDDQYKPGVARGTATREDLRLAIEELLDQRPVTNPETIPLGCIIGRAPRAIDTAERAASTSQPDSQEITYSRDVSRVLQRHCIECHRTGEIGPFAMESYEDVAGWAETMLETIEQERMPPWHADPSYGEFANARHMPQEDKQLIRDWISAGMPEGDAADLPPPVEPVVGWQLPREPDMVIAMRDRPFVVPKEGVVEYQYFVADLGFEEDKWVSAAQVIPGSPAVVHHAIAFVRPPDGAQFRGVGWLSAYVPGQRTQALPAGRARRVPAGSKIVFQMHYTPNGSEQADVTKLGLNFVSDEAVTDEVFTLLAIDQEFEIPPNAQDHRVYATVRQLPEQAELLAVTPHMHYRGKAFKLLAGADAENILLNVPRYDFNWQHTYQFARPLQLDQLQSLSFEASFDNSSANPFNPDPSQWVSWGDQTWEEMAIAFFEVSQPRRSQSSVMAATPVADAREGTTGTSSGLSAAVVEKRKSYEERMFAELDANGDGQIKRSETGILLRRRNFYLWDTDGDDVISRQEVRQAAQWLYP